MSNVKRGARYVAAERNTLNYHVVWVPRYRRAILTGVVAERLKQLIGAIATQHGFTLLALEVMPDHVHLFVSAPPRFAPSEIVRLFKGATSRRLMQEFETLR